VPSRGIAIEVFVGFHDDFEVVGFHVRTRFQCR
jgi:hypothetical protein